MNGRDARYSRSKRMSSPGGLLGSSAGSAAVDGPVAVLHSLVALAELARIQTEPEVEA